MKQLLAMLVLTLMLSVAWAETYQIMGVNITNTETTATTCNGTTAFGCGVSIGQTFARANACSPTSETGVTTSGGINGATLTFVSVAYAQSHMGTGVSATNSMRISISPPASGNYTISSGANALHLNGTAFTGTSGAITDHNATHWNVTMGNTVFFPKNTTFDFTLNATAATSYVGTGDGTCQQSNLGSSTATIQEWTPMNATPFMIEDQIYKTVPRKLYTGKAYLTLSDEMNGTFAKTSDLCRATVVYSTQLVRPRITYFPSSNAHGDLRNLTNDVAYIQNNTVTLIYDEATSMWYYVPAFACTDYVTVQTVGAMFAPWTTPSSSSGTSKGVFMSTCYFSGNTFHYSFMTYSPRTGYVYATNSSGTYTLATFSSTTSQAATSVNVTGNATAWIVFSDSIDANQTLCIVNSSSTEIFPAITLTNSSNIRSIANIFFVAMVAYSAISPLAIIPAAAMGQAFGITDATTLSQLIVAIMSISVVANIFLNESNLKWAVGMMIIAMVIAGLLTSLGSMASPSYSNPTINAAIVPITNTFTSLENMDGAKDPVSYAVNSVVIVMQVIAALLMLPYYFVSLIGTVAAQTIAASGLTMFSAPVKVVADMMGIAVNIAMILKMVEVGRNAYNKI